MVIGCVFPGQFSEDDSVAQAFIVRKGEAIRTQARVCEQRTTAED